MKFGEIRQTVHAPPPDSTPDGLGGGNRSGQFGLMTNSRWNHHRLDHADERPSLDLHDVDIGLEQNHQASVEFGFSEHSIVTKKLPCLVGSQYRQRIRTASQIG